MKPSLAWLLALAWTSLLLALSLLPVSSPPAMDWLAPDKIAHLLFYAILTLVWLNAWQTLFKPLLNQILTWSWAVGLGFTLELIQAQLPYRSFDYADALANALGASLALILWPKLQSYQHRN